MDRGSFVGSTDPTYSDTVLHDLWEASISRAMNQDLVPSWSQADKTILQGRVGKHPTMADVGTNVLLTTLLGNVEAYLVTRMSGGIRLCDF